MTTPTLPQLLGGRFRIDSVVGRGGMGAVYAATDVSINRRVAIKLLRPEIADDPISLERLREEAFSLASLGHPNVVQLYDFYSGAPDATFLVMELIQGESLTRRLAQYERLPVEVAVDYARQVLSALSAAHAKGIIHRDIKPSNVVVASVPMQKDLIKVLDFGIAKLTEETIRRRPTTAGMLLGTPSTMSPEQASGAPIDLRTDVYSAALLLYTLLTGDNPLSADGDMAATLIRVQTWVPPALCEVRPEVPRALSDVVAAAMSKRAEQRPQSAAELVFAIDHAMSVRAPHPAAATPSGVPPASFAGTLASREASHVGRPAPVEHSVSIARPIAASPHSAPASRRGPSAATIAALAIMGTLLVVAIGAAAFLGLSRAGESSSGAPPASAPAATAAPIATATGSPSVARSAGTAPTTPSTAKAPAAAAAASIGQAATKPPLVAADPPTNARCSCFPQTSHDGHGRSQPLANKVVPFECRCNARSSERLCPQEVKRCSPPATGSGDVTPAGCDQFGFTKCKSDLVLGSGNATCSGWTSIGEKKDGTLDCSVPQAVRSVAGPDGRSCTGFTVTKAQVAGIVSCEPAGAVQPPR